MNGLLTILKANALETPENIAKMLGSTRDEVEAEIARLEKEGVIRGWQAIVNEDEVSQDVTAAIEVRITPERDGGFDRIAERVCGYPEVSAAFLMSGGYDLLIFVTGKGLLDVARFVSEKLAPIHGVLSTSTHFRLKTYKQNGVLMTPIKQDERLPVSP